jgi:hypothetical protein
LSGQALAALLLVGMCVPEAHTSAVADYLFNILFINKFSHFSYL